MIKHYIEKWIEFTGCDENYRNMKANFIKELFMEGWS